jgi:hypothetical protein
MKFEIDNEQIRYAAEFIHKENSRIDMSVTVITNTIWQSVYDVATYMKEHRCEYRIQTMGYAVIGDMETDKFGWITVLVDPGITKSSDSSEYKLKQIQERL